MSSPYSTMEISSEISDENAADFVEALDQIEFYGSMHFTPNFIA